MFNDSKECIDYRSLLYDNNDGIPRHSYRFSLSSFRDYYDPRVDEGKERKREPDLRMRDGLISDMLIFNVEIQRPRRKPGQRTRPQFGKNLSQT